MAKNFFDVYGCKLCEREVATDTGNKKELVCCDLPMRLVKENTEFEKIDSQDWPVDKLMVVLDDEVGFAENNFISKELISTPTVAVKVISFMPGQATFYEKAVHDICLFVVEGDGNLALGYEDLEMAKSTVVVVPKGMLWGIKNNGNVKLVILQTVNKTG